MSCEYGFVANMDVVVPGSQGLDQRRSEDGRGTLEYVIIAAFITVAAVALVAFIVSQIDSAKTKITTAANPNTPPPSTVGGGMAAGD